jgi:hypothetical protein
MGNWDITFMRITGSTTSGPHSAVFVGGDGGVCGLEEGAAGEVDPNCETYGAPGIVFRPRPPEDVSTADGTETLSAEAIGRRSEDGLVPMAWRDLRLNRAFKNPAAGTFAFVGYGGGFHSLDDTASNSGDQKATIQVLYVPYQFTNGVPAKAHCIIIDPAEGISVIHGEGQSILMQDDGSITQQSPDGQTYLKIENGKISLQAGQIVLNGGAVIVGNPLGPIVPLAAGPASPPCPRLMLNPAA